MTVQSPDECGRRPYARSAEAEAQGRGYFECSWCGIGVWHAGTDPGRLEPCRRCGIPVAIRDRRPIEGRTGRLHLATSCRRIVNGAEA